MKADEACAYLLGLGCVITDDGSAMDTKKSIASMVEKVNKQAEEH
jgi:hypothetical protein